MQVHQLLDHAWNEVEKSGVPAHLHELAFKEVLARLLGSAPLSRLNDKAVRANLGSDDVPEKKKSSDNVPSMSLFDKFAEETGLDREALEAIYHFEDGVPGLNGPARKFGSNKATQTRAIALALTVAYHFVLDELETSVEVVRNQCETLKCYDQANFSSCLGKLTTVTYSGAKGKKMLKTKRDSLASLQMLLNSFQGVQE